MKSKVALITGVTGQDGSYLAELLLSKGYEVHGLIRRSSTFNTSRIDHIYQDPHDPNPKLFLHYGDLIDGVGLTNLIREIKPDEVYNLGAQSHVQVSFTMPQYTGQVDAVGAVGLLEALRSADTNARFYQASTSELYGSTYWTETMGRTARENETRASSRRCCACRRTDCIADEGAVVRWGYLVSSFVRLRIERGETSCGGS